MDSPDRHLPTRDEDIRLTKIRLCKRHFSILLLPYTGLFLFAHMTNTSYSLPHLQGLKPD